MKNKKGISLIVLVITIIVMIILAATIILTINNNNILDKAQDTVRETNKIQIQELAETLWASAYYIDGLRTQEELEKAVLDGLKDIDTSKYKIDVTTSGVVVSPKNDDLVEPEGPVTHSGTIPRGATYYVGVTSNSVGDYTGATATYTEGQSFPEEVQNGDIYVYGDYEYRYNRSFGFGTWLGESTSQEGWGTRVIDTTKNAYGDIIVNINDEVVNCLACTFLGCKNMVIAPEIPETIYHVYWMFSGCTSLTTAPVFAEHIDNLNGVFQNCDNLITYVGSNEEPGSFANYIIPDNIITANQIFTGCDLIKIAPDFSIATKLENMSFAFSNCEKLEVPPTLPNSIKDMYGIFQNCIKLKTAPKMPNSVTDLGNAFYGCSALVSASSIPANVKSLAGTFGNCVKLTGSINISANPSSYTGCFEGTELPIKIIGSCSTQTKINLSTGYTNVSY